jgi:hypothetical protein
MGVTGKGLQANGLHKRDMNGSPADHNGATESARTGTGGGLPNTNGLNKLYGNTLPVETATVVKSGRTTKITKGGC